MAKPFQYLAGAASDGSNFLPAVSCLEPTGHGSESMVHWLLYNPLRKFPQQEVALAAAESELATAFVNPMVMLSDQTLSKYLQTKGFVQVEYDGGHLGDATPLDGQTAPPQRQGESKFDPMLHALIMQTIDSQIVENDPPETRETLQQLVSAGYTAEDAKRLIGAVVATELIQDLHCHEPFNRDRYVQNLKRLQHIGVGQGIESEI
ncbi:MAG TPA: hypothetical protein VMW27_23725 [Thermoanaerobaculia bacterium]|nr:hypothetical protein [Thermoanaerobaculia bacterium]